MPVTHGYPARLVDRGSIRDGRLLGHPQRDLAGALLAGDPAAPFLAGEYPDMDTAGYSHPARRLASRKAAEMEPAEALRYDG